MEILIRNHRSREVLLRYDATTIPRHGEHVRTPAGVGVVVVVEHDPEAKRVDVEITLCQG